MRINEIDSKLLRRTLYGLLWAGSLFAIYHHPVSIVLRDYYLGG